LYSHYAILHEDKFGVLEGKVKEDKLKNHKCGFQLQQNVFTVANKTVEAAVQASFIMLQIIVTNLTTFADGEYVKECIMKAAEILCPEKQHLYENISLSANMVAKRVNDLVGYVQCQLKDKCKNFVAYSVVFDESADVKGKAKLSVFIRSVIEDSELVEELLKLFPTKGKNR
jgi:hypothetical protein